jgi:hypothetical protein
MNKITHVLIGPELFWTLMYLVLILFIRMTGSPIKTMDSFWVNMAYVIPVLLIPLSFALYYFPGVIRDWLLLRIWSAGILGSHFLLDRSLLAHTEQGPGVGMAYIMGMIFVFVVLFIGSIWALIKF